VKAARFFAHFGMTETLFRQGAPADTGEAGEDFLEPVRTPFDWRKEMQTRAEAAFSERDDDLHD
jgi:hypothetical protein